MEKKAEMKREGQAGAEDLADIDKVDVEKEIQVKLLYLEKYHRLKEGRRSFSQGATEGALLMRIISRTWRIENNKL